MNKTDELLPVTQGDREAAGDFFVALGQSDCGAIREGLRDQHALVQAFARHRIASQDSQPTPSDSEVVAAQRHMLDRDRYIVAIALGQIRKALDGHRWLLDGRGPYEWDDDEYRDEFKAWVENVEAATGLLGKLAWDKNDCETTPEKVAAAREAARIYAVDAPKGHRDILPSDLGLPCPACAALPTPSASEALSLLEGAIMDGLAHWNRDLRAEKLAETSEDEWRAEWRKWPGMQPYVLQALLARIDNLIGSKSDD